MCKEVGITVARLLKFGARASSSDSRDRAPDSSKTTNFGAIRKRRAVGLRSVEESRVPASYSRRADSFKVLAVLTIAIALVLLAAGIAAAYLLLKNMTEEGIEIAAPGSCNRGRCGSQCQTSNREAEEEAPMVATELRREQELKQV